jgi:hypothetical protein
MDLSYFETVDEAGNVSYIRPETKSISDLERVIKLNKPLSVVDKFTELYLLGEQWNWLEAYQAYLIEVDEVNEHNENPPVTGTDESGNDIYAEQKELPVEPVRPALVSVDDFKAGNDLFTSYTKNQGAEINGVEVSLNESNQNGIAAVLTGLKLAEEVGENMFPLTFKAESVNGTVSIPFTDLTEFKAFAMQFMSQRQAFFN